MLPKVHEQRQRDLHSVKGLANPVKEPQTYEHLLSILLNPLITRIPVSRHMFGK